MSSVTIKSSHNKTTGGAKGDRFIYRKHFISFSVESRIGTALGKGITPVAHAALNIVIYVIVCKGNDATFSVFVQWPVRRRISAFYPT